VKQEKYRQSILADNNARREGRYKVWNAINLNTTQAESLFKLIVDHWRRRITHACGF
jgi:hypothetical protein